MKKLMILLVAILAASALIVSCNSSALAVDSELTGIQFEGRKESFKGLVATIGSIDTTDYYWFYAADKQDTGGTSGETASYDYDGAIAVKSGATGLDQELTGFSVGDWKFKLFAYTSANPTDKSAYEYSGESAVTKLTFNVKALVKVPVTARVTEGNGTIVFSGITAPGTTGGEIRYKVDNGSYSTTATYSVTAGTHTVYAAHFDSSEPSADMTIENRITVSVVKGVSTTISGTIDDLTTTIEFVAGKYTVAYSANLAPTGTPPTDGRLYAEGESVTVAGQGSMAFEGKTFGGWNTKADGTGDQYAAGATMTMPGNSVILYAVWE